MCLPLAAAVAATAVATAASGAYSAYSSYQQGAAQQKFSQYQSDQEKLDAQAALNVGEAQSEQVAQQAELDSQTLAYKNAQEAGAQRTAESADGISSNSVTAENLAVNSFNKGNRDEAMLNYNAENKIWSIQTAAAEQSFTDTQQSQLDIYGGKEALEQGEVSATGTLLSTAAQTASVGIRGATVSPTGTPLGK